jgi:hypothetical protein
MLVVYNNTRTDVDVIAFEGRRENVLGIASPGRHEFMLTDAVEFRVECR